MILKKPVFLLLVILILCFGITWNVSAYYMNIDVPREVHVGDVINVTGMTNIPPDSINIIFSETRNIPIERGKETIILSDKGDKSFNTSFETTDLVKGQYKIEVIGNTIHAYSGGSRSIRIINLVDRSDEVILTSPDSQQFDGELDIEGYIRDFTENAVQIDLFLDGNPVFGPEFIPVNKQGDFSYDIPIFSAGPYTIRFTDYNGMIGSYPILVKEQIVTSLQTVKPISTSTPLPLMTRTLIDTAFDPDNALQVSAKVSRDAPGYFLITANETNVLIQTSSGVDWVMEYITDDRTDSWKVNDKGRDGTEDISLTVNPDDRIYVKVYPYSFTAMEDITLFAQNAKDIGVSSIAAEKFGSPGTTPGSPLPIVVVIAALGLAMTLICKREQ